MWVQCTETTKFIGTDDISVEEGKVYKVAETIVDPSRIINGQPVELAKGTWYRFIETDKCVHWGGRFKELAPDSPEVMEHVRKFLFGNACLNE